MGKLTRGHAHLIRVAAWQVASLAVATAAAAILIQGIGLPDASAVYLSAVAVVAIRCGTWAAAITAFESFLLYNFLFVEPRLTFLVASPGSVITLLLLLALGVVIGRLAGAEHDRAEEAARREEEARSLVLMASALATARRTLDALPAVLPELADAGRLACVWIGLGTTATQEQIIAIHDPRGLGGRPEPSHFVLRTTNPTMDPAWVRLSPPSTRMGVKSRRGDERDALALHRIEVTADREALGSLWFLREANLGRPINGAARLLQAAAEQIGQGLRRDRLAEQATELEIALRSDELKSALLDSVSHDLRTPLASIRAAAGNLADPELNWTVAEQRTAALEIDREATRLTHLVEALLDMSRIRAGSLHPQAELLPTRELLHGVIERISVTLGRRHIQLDVEADLPLLSVDPIFADQILSNVLENAVQHTAADAPIRVLVAVGGPGVIEVVVEDGGPGVPDSVIGRVFEPFYRVPGNGRSPGAGLGLAVVRGLAEAMGGHASARRSDLGGLAVSLELPAQNAP